MGGGQLTGILHVLSEIPELLEADAGNVDNVVGLGNRRLAVRAVWDSGAERQGEAQEIFVESEEADELGRRLPVGGGLGYRLFIGRHALRSQMGDLEDVDRDATLVPPTGPLWVLPQSQHAIHDREMQHFNYQPPCLVVFVDVNGLV